MIQTYTSGWMALLILLGISFSAPAQTSGPVFSDDIAPILYQNCTPCHRQGGIAPFALETYQDARTYSAGIQFAVRSRHMPPWPPDPSYVRFKGERKLTQTQIDAISDWVDNNTPRGNPANDPPLPIFNDSSALPVHPQATWRIPPYTIQGNSDEYRVFVLPAAAPQQRWIKMLELLPANRKAVHHILLYADTTGTCRRLDSLDPGPGYTAVGGIGASQADLLGGWAPGSPPLQWPLTFGSRLRRSADLVMQVHYAPGSQGMRDSSSVNMVFHPAGTPIREVLQAPVLNHQSSLTNGPLALDPGQIKTFNARFVNFADASILNIFPHAHMLCRNWEVFATPLAGRPDTVRLIKIPDWHFHWQGSYFYQKPVRLRSGMVLQAKATYDNSANNPFNPFNPPRRVTEGEGTGDEMMLVYFAFAAYRQGDENLIIDSSMLVNNRELVARDWEPVLQGRSDGRVEVLSSMPIRSVTISDATGRITYTGPLPESGLPFGREPVGIYFVRLENSQAQYRTVRWSRQ